MNVPVLTPGKEALSEARDQADDAVRAASPWIEWLGRFGYAAKGIVYAIVGLLAAQAASGAGGATTDTRGALAWIIQAPFGRFLLAALALGLVGYALWRLVEAGWDTECKGSDASGLATRGAYAVIGLIYLGLALTAARMALGTGDAESGGTTQDWTAWLLAQPFGRWLVALAGAIVIGSGLQQFYRAYSAKFREKLRLDEMSAEQQTWVTRIGRLGFAARGVAFGIIGGFLLVAAFYSQAEQARGLGGALATVAEQPFGPWLLGIVAVGLIAYGAFELTEARYRRMLIR